MAISLIIGNGFSIDASINCRINANPNYPWSFDLRNPYNSNEPLLKVFPHLEKHLVSMGEYKNLGVYESLKNILEFSKYRPAQNPGEKPSFEDWVHYESCHYLRLAYSWYSNLFNINNLVNWNWWNKSNSTYLPWAEYQLEAFKRESNSCEVLLIVGFGMGEPDKEEFKELLSSLHEFDVVQVVDPYPNNELIKILENKSKKPIEIYIGIG